MKCVDRVISVLLCIAIIIASILVSLIGIFGQNIAIAKSIDTNHNDIYASYLGQPSITENQSYFTMDFLGKITRVKIAEDGSLLEDMVALSPNGSNAFEIRKGTVAKNINGEIIYLIEIRETQVPSLPAFVAVLGKAYEFLPSDIYFSNPIRLILGYDADDLPISTTNFGTANYTVEDGWTYLEYGTSGVAELGKVTVEENHFTTFAIISETLRPEPSEWSEAIKETCDEFSAGSMFFNPPKEMIVNNTQTVDLTICKEKEFDKVLSDKLSNKGYFAQNIEVGDFMTAKLTGAKFDIVEKYPARQVVIEGRSAPWSWDVTPTESGDQKLDLTLTIRLKLLEGEEETPVPLDSYYVKVKANFWHSIRKFLENYWEFLLGGLTVPVLLWYLDYRKKKQKAKKKVA